MACTAGGVNGCRYSPGIAGTILSTIVMAVLEVSSLAILELLKMDPKRTPYSPGIEIKAKQTIFSEGCRGSLTERIKKNFKLDKDNVTKQHYGIGLKEVWRVAEGNPHYKAGRVQHTVNWPLPSNVIWRFLLVSHAAKPDPCCLVVGLDY